MAKKDGRRKSSAPNPDPHPEPLFRSGAHLIRRTEEVDPEHPDAVWNRKIRDRVLASIEEAPYQRQKDRYFVFTEDDERAFSDLLKEAFPTIRFYRDPLDSDQEELATAQREGRTPRLRAADSLADPEVRSFHCWLEPEGWTPRIESHWLRPNRLVIRNLPHLSFTYRNERTPQKNRYSNLTVFRRKTKPLPPLITLYEGNLRAHYRIDDEPYKAFLRKAFNLVTKVASNKLIIVDEITGSTPGPPKPRGEKYWAGYHALAWCKEDLRRVLTRERYRPADEWEWRSKIPREHPDYYSPKEASELLEARFNKEFDAFTEEARERRRQLREEDKVRMSRKGKKNIQVAKKLANAKKPTKKKGG